MDWYIAPECHLVELLQDGFVETLADTVGPWMIGFRSGMLNVIEQISRCDGRFSSIQLRPIWNKYRRRFADKFVPCTLRMPT